MFNFPLVEARPLIFEAWPLRFYFGFRDLVFEAWPRGQASRPGLEQKEVLFLGLAEFVHFSFYLFILGLEIKSRLVILES